MHATAKNIFNKGCPTLAMKVYKKTKKKLGKKAYKKLQGSVQEK